MITDGCSNDLFYEKLSYSEKEFANLFHPVKEQKTLVEEIENHLKNFQIKQVFVRKYKEKKMILFLNNNTNK